jgi:hypothetical protein
MNILLCELNQNLGLGFWIPILISIILAFWNLFQQLKIETLRKEIEKQLLVHRLQFEKEFNIYNELWAKLVDLRAVITLLRPKVGTNEPGKNYDETVQIRLDKAIKIGNEVIEMVEKNKPFYAKAIYFELLKIIKIIRAEVIEVTHGDRRQQDYWVGGEKNIGELLPQIEVVCEAIRERIGNIEVK